MPTTDHHSLRDLTFRIFRAAGAPEDEARIVSEHLVNSNLVGHDSHGVWHVPGYARGMQRRYTPWEAREVLREHPSFVLIDGHGANGIVAVTHAAEMAIARARGAAVRPRYDAEGRGRGEGGAENRAGGADPRGLAHRRGGPICYRRRALPHGRGRDAAAGRAAARP